MPSARRLVFAALSFSLIVSMGCFNSSFQTAQRLYEQGEFDLAIEAYDNYLSSEPVNEERSATALYRIALMHAQEDGGTYDPERSASLFRRVCESYPASKECSLSSLIRGLQIEIQRLTQLFGEEEAYSRSMTTSLARLRSQVGKLESRLEQAEEGSREQGEEMSELTRQLRSAQRLAAQKQTRIDELEVVLEELRRIALDTPP